MTLTQATQTGLNALINANLETDGEAGPLTSAAITQLQNKLSNVFSAKGYEPCSLIGIRMSDVYTNQFSDWGVLMSGDNVYVFPMSTKPGYSFQENEAYVASVHGCACLQEGQYKGMWSYRPAGGWSGDEYLMQVSPVTVYRDSSLGHTIDRTTTDTGMFGINFHTWQGDNAAVVGNLSAGCQVMDEVVLDEVMPYLRTITANIDYTLLNFADFN